MFDEVLINSVTKKHIQSYIDKPFACLGLIGPEGSGKSFLGRKIAEKLLGQINQINIVELDGKLSGIKDIRELQKDLSLKSINNALINRIVLIHDADKISLEAQNSLLKMLEEPPSDCLILLTISREKKIIETIYSRIKKIYIKPVNKSDFNQKIISNYPETELSKSLGLSMGQPGLFINLLKEDTEHQLVKAIEYAKIILKMPKYHQLAEIDSIIKKKDTGYPELVCDAILRILHASHMALLNQSADTQKLKTSTRRLEITLDTINSLSLGLNKKLTLTRLFIKL